MGFEQPLQSVLTDTGVLAAWAVLVVVSLAGLAYDLRTNNAGIAPLLKFVWGLTVLYSGPVEHRTRLAGGFRSVAHCYSGCGAGEVIGVTVGPLVQDGESFRTAMLDALYSETPSITVMEVAAIGTDVWLAGDAHIGEPLFWSALIFSLTVGLLIAYPVNVFLVHRGVKEGMQNPRQAASA